MPNWSEIVEEVKAAGAVHDVVRRKYLAQLHELTGRNTIIYYSGWLQKNTDAPSVAARMAIDDADKNGFMAAIHQLDRTKGLDLILHTPGGDVAATESLIEYLRSMFGTDMRAIVPQIAMSGGTMMALACDEIIMGEHSSIGPIDPQLGPWAAHAIIEEFERARKEIAQQGNAAAAIWQPIIAKYPPTLVGEAQKAIAWSDKLTRESLETGMFRHITARPARTAAITKVIEELGDHALTLSHNRHVGLARARQIGLNVTALEDEAANPGLQDAVLTVHHVTVQTLADHDPLKIIENHRGIAQMTGIRVQK